MSVLEELKENLEKAEIKLIELNYNPKMAGDLFFTTVFSLINFILSIFTLILFGPFSFFFFLFASAGVAYIMSSCGRFGVKNTFERIKNNSKIEKTKDLKNFIKSSIRKELRELEEKEIIQLIETSISKNEKTLLPFFKKDLIRRKQEKASQEIKSLEKNKEVEQLKELLNDFKDSDLKEKETSISSLLKKEAITTQIKTL